MDIPGLPFYRKFAAPRVVEGCETARKIQVFKVSKQINSQSLSAHTVCTVYRIYECKKIPRQSDVSPLLKEHEMGG